MKKKYYSPSVEVILLADKPVMASYSQTEDNDADAKPNPWSDDDDESSDTWGHQDRNLFED